MSASSDDLLAEAQKRVRSATVIKRDELLDLHLQLGLLGQKLDSLIADGKRIDCLAERVQQLELFKAQMQVWGIVAGGLWTLILTFISIKVGIA